MPNRYNTNAGRVFDVFNVILLGAVGVLALLPFLFIIGGSLATEAELTSRSFFIWPEHFSLDSYSAVFATSTFLRSLAVTIGVTAVGTLIQLAITVCMAYPLARRRLPGRNIMISLIVFAMVFSAGIIPTFLMVKNLGLLNNWWALILPAAVNPFYLIIIKNFFQELPIELEESAMIDGATELRILWSILLPLSKPVLATFALFYAVGIWNDYMSPLLYLSDSSMWTLQMFLRQVTVATTVANPDPNYILPAQGIKYAVVVVATVPILLFYPFLQKYFTKGVLIGAVKG